MGEPASSHWKECGRHFKVRAVGDHDFKLAGYGFGSSDRSSLTSRLLAELGNGILFAYLRLPGLWQDIKNAKTIVGRMGLWFSQDAFRQVCTLNLIRRQLGRTAPTRILLIGDGPGILSSLLHTQYPNARLFLADLGPVLFFQCYNHHKAFPFKLQSVTDDNANENVEAIFNYCPADRLDSLPKHDFDLAINVASMQEMDAAVTATYFELLRYHNTSLFYCCNRLEKHLVGGEISLFMDYPWIPADEHLIDEPCPWHQWFFGRSGSPHVKFLGFPVPFMHRYDGQHWHRLTRLAKVSQNE